MEISTASRSSRSPWRSSTARPITIRTSMRLYGVEARRLRSKLKAYYEEGPGRSDPVLIGLQPGSYVPIFRWLERGPQENRKEIGTSIQTAVHRLPCCRL